MTQRQAPQPQRMIMGVVNVDPVFPVDKDEDNARLCLIGRRVPFVYATGEPYAVLDFVVPVKFNGSREAFANDGRKVTARYDIKEIPSRDGSPYRLSVGFSPTSFAQSDDVAMADSLPVIVT